MLLLDCICTSNGTVKSEIGDRQLAAYLQHDAYGVLTEGKTQVVSYSLEHGSAEVLIEVIRPPVPLLIFGAGYDAVPIVQLAKQLGWHVTLIDRRPAYATRDRFPDADEIIGPCSDCVLFPNVAPAIYYNGMRNYASRQTAC